ncbi:MAG: pseudouridine synthase [Acidiphilium sp.]
MSDDGAKNGDAGSAKGERIAKVLARAGIASRRDIERMIGEGRIVHNGTKVAHPATFVGPGDIVLVDGKPVAEAPRTRLWRYHKPDGLLTTHRDPTGRPTVFERLPADMPRVVSVGRLDLNSEGLLLLTNDGAMARRLELPSTGWKRRYRVRVYGMVDSERLVRLKDGITVDGVRYGPIEAEVDSAKGMNTWLSVSIAEGRNREIRRVMAALGLETSRLIRMAYGPFQLGNLATGAVAEVTGKVLREQLPKS